MSRLVDDLMSLSRLELRANIAPDQKVDLVPVIGHVRDALLPLANELDVVITLHLPDRPAEVQGDRDELVQVFQNLVENACKYGQEGKVVDVWLRAEPGKPVEVSVIDKGPGIPAEHVPRLTERFYRVSVADSRSKKGPASGLPSSSTSSPATAPASSLNRNWAMALTLPSDSDIEYVTVFSFEKFYK